LNGSTRRDDCTRGLKKKGMGKGWLVRKDGVYKTSEGGVTEREGGFEREKWWGEKALTSTPITKTRRGWHKLLPLGTLGGLIRGAKQKSE